MLKSRCISNNPLIASPLFMRLYQNLLTACSKMSHSHITKKPAEEIRSGLGDNVADHFEYFPVAGTMRARVAVTVGNIKAMEYINTD